MPITSNPGTPPGPKPRGGNKSTPVPAPSSDTILRGRAEAVSGLFQMGAAVCIMVKQLPDSAAISEHGDNVSIECAKLAETDERFANVIDKLTSVGPYAGLMTAIMPLMVQLAVNHKRMEAGALGTVEPEVLAAKVKADMAEKRTEYLKAARQATDRANQAEAELAKVA